MTKKQLANLYEELGLMYYEEFPNPNLDSLSLIAVFKEKIEMDELTKKDIAQIEPVFSYGHVDVHRYLKAKKRFIWF